jgi:hypothetical protein
VVIVRLLVRVVLVALIPVGVMAEAPNRHNVDFSGSWELDYQLSDHPSEKIRYLYVQARAQAERALERAQNSGRYVDPRIFNVESVVGLGRLAEKIAQATVLTITQENDHVVINRNDDFALICDFGDMGWKQSAIGTEGCAWDEDQLAFQIALPDGLSVYHQFSIAADRSRINVATTVKVSGISYPFTLNRVYMPFEPGEGMFECTYTIANQTSCTLSGSNE